MTDPSLGQKLTLDDLVPRTGLDEVCRSFTKLFDVPLRILRTGEAPPSSTPQARYAVGDIRYEGDVIGSVVVGPFVPAESLVGIPAPTADAPPPTAPRIKPATADRLVKHVLAMLDVMLWSGHRAFLASQMQVASAGEAYREITAKNRALAESLRALQEVDRLKSNFMGTISHELRTPLTSILGYAEMLAEGIGGQLTIDQREFVQIIRGKGEALLAMISNILELSKLDTETSPHARTEVDLRALCEDLLGAAEGAASRRKITLELTAEPNLPRIETDLERLRKIVTHLLDNAIKFTTPGGSVHVTLAAEMPAPDEMSPVGFALLGPANEHVALKVTDTGIGISPEDLPYVFDAFYQVDGSSTREYGGSGLGLAIVKRLTESLGGRVTATSEPGRGSEFRVVLPVVAAA